MQCYCELYLQRASISVNLLCPINSLLSAHFTSDHYLELLMIIVDESINK